MAELSLKAVGSRKKPKSISEGLNVRRKQCAHCLFGPNSLLDKKARDEKIKSCLANDKTFACHEFDNVTCKGFFDKHKKDVIPTRIGIALNAIVWVD